jgi:hypothetical protein
VNCGRGVEFNFCSSRIAGGVGERSPRFGGSVRENEWGVNLVGGFTVKLR